MNQINQIKKSGRGGARPGAGRPRKNNVEQKVKKPMGRPRKAQVEVKKSKKPVGRPALTPEQKFEREQQKRQIIIDELLFPAICSAWHEDPGVWQERMLIVELSKTQIKLAYGAEGLREWCDWFTSKKIGGINRYGVGYKTTWTYNLSKYSIGKKIIESLGHSIKDLPKMHFPPPAMVERLKAIDAKAEAKRAKKAEPIEAQMKRELELA